MAKSLEDEKGFKVISSYEISGKKIVLEKKVITSDYRHNGDGTLFYRTKLALGIIDGKNYERTVLETNAYTPNDNSDASRPCMIIDPKKQVLYIFSISKSADVRYGMDGFIYRLDMQNNQWTREMAFASSNFGWFSFFGGSNDGNPELWHFSFAGYYAMKSTRISNGKWMTEPISSIDPDVASKQYAYHENILLTSSPGVDKMSNSFSQRSTHTQRSTSSHDIHEDYGTAIGIVGTGVIVYGLYKLLNYMTSGISSSSSSSSSSTSSRREKTETVGSNQSNSSSSSKTYSAKVHLRFQDGDEPYKSKITVFFKGFMNTSSASFYTDNHGNATLTWTEAQGTTINCICLSEHIGFHNAYSRDDIEINDGGNYEICMDCNY